MISSWRISIARCQGASGLRRQAAVKHMKEGGRIINIGSTNAEAGPKTP
jgi:NAD(P)-dependent dehydrogenase (short-subunit alcohol dehydrogenase family)